MLIRDPRLDHELDITPDYEVYLKYSEATHLADGGTPQGFIAVDMFCPWWGLTAEQQAALMSIHDRAARVGVSEDLDGEVKLEDSQGVAAELIEEAARVIVPKNQRFNVKRK